MAQNKRVDVKKALAVPRVEEPWETELRDKARAARAVEVQGIARLTYKGGILTLDGKPVKDNKLAIVPIGLMYAKQWYEHEYVPGSTDTPGCYSFKADSDQGMVAHASSPLKQHVVEGGASPCDGCQHNAFYTALKGNGKRCSDKRRVLFLLYDDLCVEEGHDAAHFERLVQKAQHYQFEVPPGSLKGFGRFLGGLVDSTPHGALTEAIVEVTSAPSPKGAFEVVLRFLETVPREVMPALLKRGANSDALLSQPFPVIEHQEPARPVKGQGPRRGR